MQPEDDEIFDVVDEDGRVLGAASRGECHSDPSLVHRSVCVLVFDPAGRLFLQQRSLTKDLCPGWWDLSATGRPHAGESNIAAAHRELREELGVDAELQRLGSLLIRLPAETELTQIYRCVYKGPLCPNPEEVAGGAFYSLSDVSMIPHLTDYARSILAALTGGTAGIKRT